MKKKSTKVKKTKLGRIAGTIKCWDGRKQGPSKKNKGFGPK